MLSMEKFVFIFVAFLGSCNTVVNAIKTTTLSPEVVEDLWNSYKLNFSKDYLTSEEEDLRFDNFEDNIELIMKHNAEYELGMHTYTLELNRFADMNLSEYREESGCMKLQALPRREAKFVPSMRASALLSSIDWRSMGAVTPVKNQRSCGSCYAFSAIGALEAQNFKATGKLISLSEQNVVDCSKGYGNYGCDGGWMKNVFNYIKNSKGVNTQDSYPYTAEVGICRHNPNEAVAPISDHKLITYGNEDALKEILNAVGPVSVGVDFSPRTLKLYHSGVYYDPICSSTSLSHGVLVVGYGAENGVEYWLVKNSWGESWGENGYFKLARNKNNHCGIVSYALYPLIGGLGSPSNATADPNNNEPTVKDVDDRNLANVFTSDKSYYTILLLVTLILL